MLASKEAVISLNLSMRIFFLRSRLDWGGGGGDADCLETKSSEGDTLLLRAMFRMRPTMAGSERYDCIVRRIRLRETVDNRQDRVRKRTGRVVFCGNKPTPTQTLDSVSSRKGAFKIKKKSQMVNGKMA